MVQNIVWLGVHKTGTTFLQNCLDQSQPELVAHRLKYIKLKEFRDKYTRGLINNHPKFPPAPNEFTSNDIDTNLVFDENILSPIDKVLHPEGLYMYAHERLRKLTGYLDFEAPHIVVGIRNFATFLPSLYIETLKHTPYQDFRRFLKTPLERMAWHPLVMRLRKSYPQSQISIYCYEDIRGSERKLLSKITGIGATHFTILDGKIRLGWSHKMMTELHKLSLERNVEISDVKALQKKQSVTAGHPKFDPWNPSEKLRLTEIYNEDLGKIRKDASIDVLNLVELGCGAAEPPPS